MDIKHFLWSQMGEVKINYPLRLAFYFIGVIVFSAGITLTINMQHLGIHPWDVLCVAFFEKVGLSIGSWNIIISAVLIIITWIIGKNYIKLGTFLNAILVGLFVDLYRWMDILPNATHTWIDILFIILGIVIMGFGGGMYNAAGLGAGPRDGFMLSIAEKLGAPIGRVRIITECSVLVIGLLIGGPVFIFTFIFTFIQSPIFQFTYLRLGKVVLRRDYKHPERASNAK
ncbi:YitT family protein [Oceanobacillus sp. FSL K6-0127]|uniref:YczE/YyaS/YitT family protein n=1 Tax=Oceanobacillus sp. FSL K6-0127 TaxID=2921420 RepID=UPI0030ECD3D9